MSANLEKAVTLLRRELFGGPVPATVLLGKAVALGLNRDFLKVAKKYLGVVAIPDRDLQTGRTRGWRWSMPKVAPVPPPTPSRPPLIPHRWAVYSYNADGRYYFKREQAPTFKKLQRLIARFQLEPPLWIYLKSAPSESELFLPIRIVEGEVRALGQRWRLLEELTRRRRPVGRRIRARRLVRR